MFCYDEQNRLVWAGSTGTPTCSGPTLSPGNLTSAFYTQTFSYDAFNRLITGPLGNYTYGNAAHQDAVTSIEETGSPSYTASYDGDGSMTCRAPTSATTCTGSPPNGQVLVYNAERRLASWASGPGISPAHEAQDLYDGEGNRVEQVASAYTCTRFTCGEQTQGDTLYLAGGVEELTTAEPSGMLTTTKYYSAKGVVFAVSVNGSISYLASDGLGSVSAALSSGGSETAVQLYAPYGGVRYSTGTMPTARGFTGQYGDAVTGLAYYGARYYDPVAGQFTTADAPKGGQGPNRYAYVMGNPTTHTDPTGRGVSCPDPNGCGGKTPPPPKHVKCDQTCQLTQQIDDEFHDPRTRAVMLMLLNSSAGIQFLQYLLAVGKIEGDSFITWDLTGSNYGYTSISGDISLNPQIFKDYGDGTEGLIEAAGVLVHEAVESFYANAYNVRSQASQHMDYVAEWYAGEVKADLAEQYNVAMPGGSAYLMTFAQWQASPDGQSYAWEHVNQPEAMNALEPSWSYAASRFTTGFPDPMGLTDLDVRARILRALGV